MISILTRSRVFNHHSCYEYIYYAKEMIRYYKARVSAPDEVENKYQECLDNFRSYLDSLRLEMPLQKYPYNLKDRRTHRFVFTENKNGKEKTTNIILNPNWKYLKSQSEGKQ